MEMRARVALVLLATISIPTRAQDASESLTIAHVPRTPRPIPLREVPVRYGSCVGRVCFLKPDPGPCEAAIQKWFYNVQTKKCETFTYGGCKGNKNRFDTKAHCEAACAVQPIDICRLKPDVGPCDAAIPRFFYNKSKGKCEQFIYGGCEGNKNNFATRLDCQKACRQDCVFVNCFANPCDVTECPGFPNAQCVPDFCTGCDADFFVNGLLVDCKETPKPLCIPEGKRCRNLNVATDTESVGAVFFPPCCGDAQCCACGPPVVTDDLKPPLFGTCQKRCICPVG